MGYLKCNKCGKRYQPQKGENDDLNVCHCGGEIGYYLSSYELKRRPDYIPADEGIKKKNASDRTWIVILSIVAALILMALPALLIYRAYFSGSSGLTAEQTAISAIIMFLGGI